MRDAVTEIRSEQSRQAKLVGRAYRKQAGPDIDQHRLTMYDLPEDGPLISSKPSVQYPDWTEADTFTISGPIGGDSKHQGRRFESFAAAAIFYSKVQGAEPVETQSIQIRNQFIDGVKVVNKNAPKGAELWSSRYCLRFRLPRSPELLELGAGVSK